ncbi:hypothetical protein D6C77_05163 [Aureobasidium pullulans]|nr:hypothetical protein D6C77_05163 [Aureobasidium pullulans]
MDEEEMGAFMEEWLTARLGLSKPGPWHNSGDRYAHGVVHEILTFFDVELTQSDNDNYTIYIFCIFTICVIECEIQADDHNAELKEHYKKKYGGSLGLPMTLAYHDLLRLTIAHREHGIPIWSGFHEGCTSFSQLDDRGNNTLMEACTSNYAKHDFPIHTYNAIEQQIRECSIEKFGYFSKDELKINNGKDGFKYVIKDDDDNDDDDHEFGNKNYSDHEGSTNMTVLVNP